MVEIRSYGPWAVVTGASSGIGRAFAEHLAAAGLHLVLAARSTDRLETLATALTRAHGISCRVVTVDFSLAGSVAELVDATEDLDVGLLISNAGTGRPGLLLDQDLADLHRRLTVNATTHLNLTHAFGRRFVARGRGGIILVSALGAVHGLPNMAHESAAKAYVLNLGEALHHELAAAGIDVTVLLPGNVDTPIIDAYGIDRAAMPIRPQPVQNAVRESVAAFLRGRPTHIPGRSMRIMTRLLPRTRSIRLNGRMLGQAARRLAEREATTTVAPS
ncbi:SDR family NAD(P)-dependent oxidoreductase [Solwaraspora sp. WMMD937]|uniref:SDR family NAD(P)-dependent oxidoreductase n=1 Tax=Solwaraspora sp. WMMD937 TaxID=3016090 RepID=UPI00249BA4E8|nr:SDR family NAD(P)-dependent oxidoreductase [Solwaraspora sp. WMMD937]WFE21333.1 SDR family NAD(P)-dependent oxidoreductase [Solwaraspora sp. WMMD937]